MGSKKDLVDLFHLVRELPQFRGVLTDHSDEDLATVLLLVSKFPELGGRGLSDLTNIDPVKVIKFLRVLPQFRHGGLSNLSERDLGKVIELVKAFQQFEDRRGKRVEVRSQEHNFGAAARPLNSQPAPVPVVSGSGTGNIWGCNLGVTAGPSTLLPAVAPAMVGDRQLVLLHSSEQRVVKLHNPRNSCYANAIINLLLSSPPIISFLWLCELRPEVEQVGENVVQVLRKFMLLGQQVMII